MFAAAPHAPTLIRQYASYITEINFFHVHGEDQDAVVDVAISVAEILARQPGFTAANVLRSTDGSRVCTYLQWDSETLLRTAHIAISHLTQELRTSGKLENDAKPRTYSVVYADDRSSEGISVISPAYTGAIFINEITTLPSKQDRLLELVIANNELQAVHTPGYRSANFHKSHDGERAVNYSLWETEEDCIAAFNGMADMDVNLEETLEIANPDFRFYPLAFAAQV